MKRVLLLVAALAPFAAQAQAPCPEIDPQVQLADERKCRAEGGVWARHGIADATCNVYTCAPRTADGGRRCLNRIDCQYLCITKQPFPLGTPVVGQCAEVWTEFGCFNYVDGGKMVGRLCRD